MVLRRLAIFKSKTWYWPGDRTHDVCKNTYLVNQKSQVRGSYIPDVICFALQTHQIIDVDHGHLDQRLDLDKQFLLLIPWKV
ncbi:hypothetical protein TMatcc_003071 [Talaromyces marneffei ATCC 18224]